MTLGKATVEKLEAIEDKEKNVEHVGNLTKPSMAKHLVMHGKPVRVQAPKDILRLDWNASGVQTNNKVLGG